MDRHKVWLGEKLLDHTVKALKKHDFNAVWFSTGDEAKDYVLETIPSGATVGVGGSVTLRQLGLVAVLEDRGNRVYQHWLPNLSHEEERAIRVAQLTSDVFIASSNAVTMEGELINTDGTGNRVAAMIFGPRKVILVAGINKLVKDIPDGLRRVKEAAAPMNCFRASSRTPCGIAGVCNECDAPARQCRATVILERKPTQTDITVVLVNQELGF